MFEKDRYCTIGCQAKLHDGEDHCHDVDDTDEAVDHVDDVILLRGGCSVGTILTRQCRIECVFVVVQQRSKASIVGSE